MNNTHPDLETISISNFLVEYNKYVGWKIIAYLGRDKVVTIPKLLDGEPVAKIDKFAFSPLNPHVSDEQKDFLRNSLQSVTFDDELLEEFEYFPLAWMPLVFAGCEALRKPVIIDSINSMELRQYPSLLYPDCPNICPVIRRDGDDGVLIKLTKANQSAHSVVIGSQYHTVGYGAAFGDASIDVYIAEGVETVEAAAFADMTNLKNVYLPSTIKSIAANAFAGCTSLSKKSKKAISAYVTPNPFVATIEFHCVNRTSHTVTDDKIYSLTVEDVTASRDFILLDITDNTASVYLTKVNELIRLSLGEVATRSYREWDEGSIIEGERYYSYDRTFDYSIKLISIDTSPIA